MAKKLNFCTLFNSAYLSRGLALYDSLIEHCSDFELFVFAFDDVTYSHLKKLNLVNMTVIDLKDFEDQDLLEVKPTRTAVEYCWTCTPSIIKYSIDQYKLDHCTYLDADIFFFSDPRPVLEKFLKSNFSVLITPHNYTPIYEQSLTSGKYCVQFMPFKNDANGMTVLNWWRDKCIEWCYFRLEDGKLGDQMYLDTWPEYFVGVHEELDRGIGVAPWNVQQLKLTKNKKLMSSFKGETSPLVFYHFHGLKINNFKKDFYGFYYLNRQVRKLIYIPYLNRLLAASEKYQLTSTGVDPHARQGLPSLLRRGKVKIKTFWDAFRIGALHD